MRIVFSFVLITISGCCSLPCYGQDIVRGGMHWSSLEQDLVLPSDFSIQFQLHHRWISGGTHHLIAPRINGIFGINEHLSVTAGITYFGNARTYSDRQTQLQSEIRPHQGIGHHFQFGKAQFSQRLLCEERTFLETGSERVERFFIRLRYRTSLSLKLWSRQDKSWDFKWFNEVMFNTAHSHTQRAFDQNRIFAGIAYHFNRQLSMDLGYMYWVQQPVNSQKHIHFDIIRIGLKHALNLNSQ